MQTAAFLAFRERGEGLKPVRQVQQVADAPLSLPCPDTASETAKRLYAALTETPITAEELCTLTDIPVGQLFSAMTELELLGCARSYPGKRYSK